MLTLITWLCLWQSASAVRLKEGYLVGSDNQDLASDGLARSEEIQTKPPQVDSLSGNLLARKCIYEKGQQFGDIAKLSGVTVSPEEQERLSQAISRKFNLADALNDFVGTFKTTKDQHKAKRSDEYKKIQAEEKDADAEIKSFNFNYKRTKQLCDNGVTQHVRDCVSEQAKEHDKSSNQKLVALVEELMHLEEQRVHTHLAGFAAAKADYVLTTKRIKAYDKTFKYKQIIKKCSTSEQGDVKKVVAFIEDAVHVPVPDDKPHSDEFCVEDHEKGFCPEGLKIGIFRPTDEKKGAVAATVGMNAVNIFSLWAIPALAGLMAPGIGVGVAAARAAALGFATVFPTGLLSSPVIYGVFSKGAKTCICSPRVCEYEEEQDACVMAESYGRHASTNPFGRALPFMSMKCTKVHGKESNETSGCSLKSCSEQDYITPLGAHEGVPFFGKVGNLDGNLYNCLSTSASGVDSLILSTKLPGDLDNSNEQRNLIYADLGVAPIADRPAEETVDLEVVHKVSRMGSMRRSTSDKLSQWGANMRGRLSRRKSAKLLPATPGAKSVGKSALPGSAKSADINAAVTQLKPGGDVAQTKSLPEEPSRPIQESKSKKGPKSGKRQKSRKRRH